MARPKKRSESMEELTQRQQDILQAVIEDYIATAEPVGSRSLTKRNRDIGVSPATVRNVMADLEDLGYLSATHASAGRVPTVDAFRLYVERLASRGRISSRDKEVIETVATTQGDRELSVLLQETGRVLSTVSNHAALVLLPTMDDVVFKEIEFVPIRDRVVLAILVSKSGLIQQRVIELEFPVERNELRRMSNYLQSLLDGKSLAEIRKTILQTMRDERAQADEMMRFALLLGERTLASDPVRGDSVLVQGERSLLEQPEFADIQKMRGLLRAFEQKTVLLSLLEAAARPLEPHPAKHQDTRVLLGADGQVRELEELAVVTASYQTGAASGHVGVVGPMRMDYSRVIPLVEMTAGALSRSLTDPSDGDEED